MMMIHLLLLLYQLASGWAVEERLVVGDVVYNPPYTQYPPVLFDILMKHDGLSSDGVRAAWHVDLGVAHRDNMEVYQDEHSNEKYALANFQAALAIYQSLPETQENIFLTASTLFNIAETFALSDKEHRWSKEYYQNAQELFATIKNEPEARIGWAQCRLRLGVFLLSDDVSKTNTAATYFTDAVEVFRDAVQTDDSHYRTLATALQNLGTTKLTSGDLSNCVAYFEEALQIYTERVLIQNDKDDTCVAVFEALYTLSDVHLQLEQYAHAKHRYRQAMNWSVKYHLLPPNMDAEVIGDVSLQLEEYEQLLNEYQEKSVDDSAYERDLLFEDEEVLLKDYGYEGDLHVTLGALYLSTGDVIQAESHLTQSIRLYEMASESAETNMASAKFNLSVLYLKSSRYSESANLYDAAMDIFEATGGIKAAFAGTGGAWDELLKATGLDGTLDGWGNLFDSGGGGKGVTLEPATPDDQTQTVQSPAKMSPSVDTVNPSDTSGPGVMVDLEGFLHQNDTAHDEL